jgi:hypothetical protein
MSSSNFQQWNPTQANQETDSAYTADSLRSGGAPNSAILPSATANKLFYQISTFIAAFAQALANKGYPMSDASLSTLEGELANVITLADMAAYATVTALASAVAPLAPKASPALTGTPTAPTPATGDNSARIATTAFVDALIAAYATQGWVAGNFLPINNPACTGTLNIAGQAITPTPASGDNSTRVPNTAWVKAQFPSSIGASGYQKLSSGLMLQWGNGTTGEGYTADTFITFNFATAFPNAALAVTISNSNGGGLFDTPAYNTLIVSNAQFKVLSSSAGQHGFFWFAIGY